MPRGRSQAPAHALVEQFTFFDGTLSHNAFQLVTAFLEHPPRCKVSHEWLGEDPQEPVGVERPLGDESDGFGSNPPASIGRTQPIPNLSPLPVDVRHKLEPYRADGSTVHNDGKRAWRVLRCDARNVGLGIRKIVEVGKEIAHLQPNLMIVRHGCDAHRVRGNEGPNFAARP